MTRMMETLESREMFSVTALEPAVDPAAPPADTSATTDVVVVDKTVKSSPRLFQYCASGKHYPTVTL